MSATRTNASTPTGYGPVAQAFHWAVAALLVAQYAIAWTMPDITMETPSTGLIAAHLSVGSAILAVVLLRLIWRQMRPVPAPPRDLPPALRLLSRATHAALYALLFLLPVGGWISASAREWPVDLAGVMLLPRLAPTNHDLAAQVGDLHGLLAWVLLGVVGLHVAGALFHAVVKRDGVMARMLPGARPVAVGE